LRSESERSFDHDDSDYLGRMSYDYSDLEDSNDDSVERNGHSDLEDESDEQDEPDSENEQEIEPHNYDAEHIYLLQEFTDRYGKYIFENFAITKLCH